MDFTKTLNGYNPAEVEKHEAQIHANLEAEKQKIIMEIENAHREYLALEEQKKILTENLQSLRDNGLFFDANEKHFQKTIEDAKIDALEKLEEINLEKQTFIKKIEKEISKADEHLLTLQNDTEEINQEIEKVINIITIRTNIDEQINELENIIGKYSAETTILDTKKTLDTKTTEAPRLNENKIKAEFVPVKEQYKAPEVSIPQQQSVQLPVSQHRYSKSVLIADQDPNASAIIKTLMEREGYQSYHVEDAYAIMDLLKEIESIGVIIIDSMLPYIEINALIKQIRKSEKWSSAPILVTTSGQDKTKSVTILQSGANDVLEKPFNPRELTARVNRLYETSSKTSSGERS